MRKQIFYDSYGHSQLISEVRTEQGFIQFYVDKLSEVLPMQLTNELFQELLNKPEAPLTVAAIEKEITSQLEKAGIKAKSILENSITQDLQAFDKVFSDFKSQKVLDRTLSAKLKYFILKNGKVETIENFEETTKEDFCKYVETEKEEQIYIRQTQALDAINSLIELMPINIRYGAFELFEFDHTQNVFKIRNANYKKLANETK